MRPTRLIAIAVLLGVLALVDSLLAIYVIVLKADEIKWVFWAVVWVLNGWAAAVAARVMLRRAQEPA